MSATGEHRFRLYVTTPAAGLFAVDSSEITFVLPDGHTAWIIARNGKTLEGATKVHFEAGGYESEAAARDAGERVRLRLRILNAVLRLGINVPVADTISSQVADHIKSAIAKEHGAVVLDCVFGLMTFPDDERHVELTMDGNLDVSPSSPQYWLQGFEQLWSADICLDERTEDALGLLAMAGMEKSPRNRFLVTYLALERVVKTKKRHATSQILIDQMVAMIEQVVEIETDVAVRAEVHALTGAIGRLRSESLGAALARIAKENPQRKIGDMPLDELLKRCTRARHETAHPSEASVTIDYESLSRGLLQVVSGLLWTHCKLPSLEIERPADRVAIKAGGLARFAHHAT